MKKLTIIVVLVLCFATASFAQSQFCANSKTGIIRILLNGETICKSKEIAVTIGGQQGPKGDIGPMGLTGPAGYTGPSAIDATEQNIGVVVTIGGPGVLLYNPTLGSFLNLYNDGSKQELSMHSTDMFYESEDCSGKGYFKGNMSNDVLFIQSIYLGIDGVHYMAADTNVLPIKASSRKIKDLGGVCERPCYHRADCTLISPGRFTCGSMNYSVTWRTLDKTCTNDDWYDPYNGNKWVAVDMDGLAIQEIPAPFTGAITLPLRFQ